MDTLWNVSLYIGFKWQRIGFSAKGRGGYVIMYLTYSTNGRKFNKKWLTTAKLSSALSLAKGHFSTSTAVSHNGAPNAQSGSVLTMLMW